jgi:cell wall-associated NlpC family hydrolase
MRTWWTDERVARLAAEADAWRGTPFAPNSSAKGLGVSCQMLAGELFRAAGYPHPLEIPDVPIAHARFSTTSFVTAWFATRADFVPVPIVGPLVPGDVLGFQIGKTVHHLGVMLSGNQFVHVLEGLGVVVNSLADATWYSRLANAWRPQP